jgi:hypothetical protein
VGLDTKPAQTRALRAGIVVPEGGGIRPTLERVGRARVLEEVCGKQAVVATREVHVHEVKALKTRNGNTRFVLVDEGGNEYTTFKERVAAKLPGLEGRRARIDFHEQQRDGFTNVYLDDVAPLEEEQPGGTEPVERVDEVAWKTAVDAAPYLLDETAVKEEVPAEELFSKLQRFKQLVADDIEHPDDDEAA